MISPPSGLTVTGQLDMINARVGGIQAAVTALSDSLADLAALLPPPPTVGEVHIATTALTVDTEQRVQVDWTTTRTDVTGWRIARDGVDTTGGGPWESTLSAAVRTATFHKLTPDTVYHLSVTPLTAAGAVTTVIATATTAKAPVVVVDGNTAAGKLGWGPPTWSDEFTVAGRPDPARWTLPPAGGWPGHNGNGRRVPENVSVAGGVLTLRGDADARTGWVRMRQAVTHGRWEWRSRSRNTGSNGNLYHVLFLVWPSDERWPESAEYDALEYTDPNARSVSGWLHYPHPNMPVQQEGWTRDGVDATIFHNYAFEWAATGLTGWIDGIQCFHFAGGGGPNGRSDIQNMPQGAGGFQLDVFSPSGMRPAVLEVEWIRYWPVT